MRRREFIALLGGAAAWVSPARAQEPRRVIGVLASWSNMIPGELVAFVQGLKQTGFIEGKNISIELRSAEGQYNRLPSLVGDLVSRGVAVIVAFDAPASSASKAATKTIPIVFVTGADPVKTGLVDSFNRPGGNLTGVFISNSMLGPKRLELLRDLLPSISTFALLVNPNNPNVVDARETEAAANAIGRRLEVLTANTEGDLEAAFTSIIERQAGALIVMPDPFFVAWREQLVALAARYAMPTIYPFREFTEDGGLISYSPSGAHDPLNSPFQQVGVYTGKILKGVAKPADLPVQQIVKFELVINLKTAKALGLTIPPTLLARADEVIE
jgi:putative tryptophan/tyrosine transport system substrate-binding protein